MENITGVPHLARVKLDGDRPSGIDRGYTVWGQAGGYFDGDGSVYLRMDSRFVLKFALIWVDNSRDQLLQLRGFLLSQRITIGNVVNHSHNVYRLQVGSPQSALATARLLLPFCFKKREELRILIDYYEDRITGTQAISRINELVRLRVRLGKIRADVDMPSYLKGKHMSAKARGKRAAETRLARLRKKTSRV